VKSRTFVWAASAILIIALLAGCRSTLVSAIVAGDGPGVKGFLDAGADVNEKGADGFTPLHWAAYYGKADMIRLLVSRGANVNVVSPQYGTPLLIAASYGFTDAVKTLLAEGADPSIPDGSGHTASYYAKQGGFTEIVRLLGGTEATVAAAAVPQVSAPAAPPAAAPPPAKAGPIAPPAGNGRGSAGPVSGPSRNTPEDATTPVRIAVYNFRALTIDASTISTTVTATLIQTLRKTPSFHLAERKELEEFMSLNDLQQNENLDDILQVGQRMGIPFVVAGSVEKKGTVYIVQCRLVSVPAGKVILERQVRSFGEGGLDREVERLGESVGKAIRGAQ